MKVLDNRKRPLPFFAVTAKAGAVVLSPSANIMRASDVGLRKGCFFDAKAWEMLALIGDQPGEWYFYQMVELAMGGHTDLATLNADFHDEYDTGAGPGFPIVDRGHGSYRPPLKGKGILSDSETALAVGIRF